MDFTIDNHGSICILNARTKAAQEWAAEHLNGDEVQHWGPNGTVIEPRYVDDIVDGIRNDGLII